MRRLLGVLRDDRREAERAPQPHLGDIDELVAGARRAGLEVRLDVVGVVRPLPPSLELTGYRVVQQGLSNAASHAPSATVHVRIEHTATMLEISVVNGPSARPPTWARPDPGHGLLGMRERVALHGGSLEAGPTIDGGYQVEVRLPSGAEA